LTLAARFVKAGKSRFGLPVTTGSASEGGFGLHEETVERKA
jgi:hypothetical protein